MRSALTFIILCLAFGTAAVNAFSPSLPAIQAKTPLRSTDRFEVDPNQEEPDPSFSTYNQLESSHEGLDSNEKGTERTTSDSVAYRSLKDRLKSAMERSELEYQKQAATAADYMPVATRLKLAIDRRNAEAKENENVAASIRLEESLDSAMPSVSKQGIYQIRSEAQHASLLEANPDKLVVMKFKASYCKACKAIESAFITVKNDKNLENLPIIWAEFSSSPQTKDFFRRLGVLTLPTIHFYEGYRGLVENFPSAPRNFDVLRQKLALFIDNRVDPNTLELKGVEGTKGVLSDRPRMVRNVLIEDELVQDHHIEYLRHGMPFFQALSDEEFGMLLAKAQLLTFNEGDIIIRQGMPGTTFYVITSGEVEMSIRSRFEDPISTPPSYLGAVVNRLTKFDFFGERAATTGEPYAASIRVLRKTRCFAFNVEDIPESSILSKKRRATRAMVEQLSARYVLPEDYKPTYPVTERDQCILELLVRFKQIRQAAKCFEYVLSAAPLFGDTGEIARRSMLVSKLSNSQRQDFIEVFKLVDVTNSGTISLLEMRRFMDSAREKKTDEELLEMINKVGRTVDDSKFGIGLTLNEFLGVMAEAEFYSLFTETFRELDKENTGYVRAGDLDKVLGGVRDLISDDPKSIIDVEDQEVQVDYEQFAKMLLGAAL